MQRVHRDDRAGDVAEPGHQAEQRVDAETPLGAGNGERLVEQHRDGAQPLERAPAALFTVVTGTPAVHCGVHVASYCDPSSAWISAAQRRIEARRVFHHEEVADRRRA